MATDELAETRRRVAALESAAAEAAEARAGAEARASAAERQLAAHLDAVSQAIEQVAERLEGLG